MAINAVSLDAIVLLNTYTRGCFHRGRAPQALGSLRPAPSARATASPCAPCSVAFPPAHRLLPERTTVTAGGTYSILPCSDLTSPGSFPKIPGAHRGRQEGERKVRADPACWSSQLWACTAGVRRRDAHKPQATSEHHLQPAL